jgi:hypothetical protein
MRTFPVPRASRHEVLLDLVEDREGRWRRPWIAACALYAAAGMAPVDLETVTVAAEGVVLGVDGDADIVRETLAGIRERRLDPA